MATTKDALEETPFNVSLGYLQKLVLDKMDLADQAKIDGHPVKYYRCLELVWMNTYDHFNSEENNECHALVQKCEAQVRGSKIVGAKVADMQITELEQICDVLKMLLMSLCFKYELLYRRTSGETWQERMEDEFE